MNWKRISVGLVLLGCLIVIPDLQAQKTAINWYFGNEAGLSFDERYPMPVTDGKTHTLEGVATVSDSLGNLLFYTDGITVWNANHEIIGGDLMGHPSSTMSANVLPSRINSDQYMLFTTTAIVNGEELPDGGHYYMLDFSENNPGGEIIADYNSMGTGPIQLKSTEKFTGIPYPESLFSDDLKPGYWIITHEFDRFSFQISQFDDHWISGFTKETGVQHSNGIGDMGANKGATGQMKATIHGDKIAVAIEGQQVFQVFNFNKETGSLSNYPFTLPAGDPDHRKEKIYGAYGVEFSPSGRFVYGTSRDGGTLYQWDLEGTNVVEEVYILRHNPDKPCGSLQLAPNGKIYLAINGQDYLGVINRPDRFGKNGALYEEYGVRLLDNETGLGGTSTFGLPQFDMSEFEAKPFSYSGSCYGDTTEIYVNGEFSSGWSWRNTTWYISDPETGGLYTIIPADISLLAKYVFPAPGEYDVRMESSFKGNAVDYTERITIYDAMDVSLAEKDYTRLCRGDSMILDAGNGAFYEWADESYRDRAYVVTEDDFAIGLIQKYRVKVTDYKGCIGWDTIQVEIKSKPQVDFEYTKAICGDSSGSARVVPYGNVENYFYRWEDFADNTTNLIENVPGGEYVVYVTSRYAGCEAAYIATVPTLGGDDVKIISSVNTTICLGTSVTLSVEGATLFEWLNPAGETGAEIQVSPTEKTEYLVKAISRDELGNECITYASYTIDVFPDQKPELGEDLHACEGDTIEIEGPDGYASWSWNNGMNGKEIELLENVSSLAMIVIDENGCVFSDTIAATFHPSPEVNLGDDVSLCTNEAVNLSGGEGDSYYWNTGSTEVAIEVFQSGVYSLEITQFGCSNSDTVDVYIMNPDSLFIDSVRARDITCFGNNNGQIQIFAHGTGSQYLYSIDHGQSFRDNGGLFNGLSPGFDYQIVVMEDSMCTKALPDPSVITEPEEIEVEFRLISPSCPTCMDGTIILTDISGGTPPYSVQWSTLDTGLKVSGLAVGNYIAYISDESNCTLTARTFLELGFRIPNAFTPNDDGINDLWEIKVLDSYNEVKVQVFNSEGQIVFDSPLAYPEPWDGTFQGNPLAMGTYYYLIRLSPDQKPISGSLTILR
jgi:gliding motility-associated-like protein